MRRICAVSLIVIALVAPIVAQPPDGLRAQLDRIFKAHAYDAPRFGPARWLPDGSAYAIVERGSGGSEIARYDAATGARSILARTSLDIDDYTWGADGKKLMVFTHT